MLPTRVIHIPTAPWYHYAGDLAAWIGAFLGARWVYRHRRASVDGLARQTEPGYFVSLAAGGALGAWLLGSLNTLRDTRPVVSHSIAGALAGAIVAVELWKWVRGVRGSTGGPFVIPLAGLGDQTYGVPTTLPWGVDLGDGVSRHPVEIYESLAMALFLAIYWHALVRRRRWAVEHGFHAFVLFYAVQRFATLRHVHRHPRGSPQIDQISTGRLEAARRCFGRNPARAQTSSCSSSIFGS